MKKRDRQGLLLLALTVLAILVGFWVTLRSSNLRNDVTGGTPFAQDPGSATPQPKHPR